MPTRPVSSTSQPVSSRVSRTAACASDSPLSRCPAGWFRTLRPSMLSLTSRTRRPSLTMVATVTWGAQRPSTRGMSELVGAQGQLLLELVGSLDRGINGIGELVGTGVGIDLDHVHGDVALAYPAADLGRV